MIIIKFCLMYVFVINVKMLFGIKKLRIYYRYMCECVIIIMCSKSVKVNIFYWIEIFFESILVILVI